VIFTPLAFVRDTISLLSVREIDAVSCAATVSIQKRKRERERERERVKAPTGRGWGGAHWHMGSNHKDLSTISADLVQASDSWLRPTLWASGKITRDLFLCHGSPHSPNWGHEIRNLGKPISLTPNWNRQKAG